MNPQVFADQLEHYRHRFERGEYEYAVVAAQTCAQFGLPIPEWLEHEVCAAMEFYFRLGGAKKRGKGGGHLVRTRNRRKDILRFQTAERELARGLTRPKAFERASVLLRSTDARGSASTIEGSYDAIAPLYRKERRKPGRKPNRRTD